MLKPVLQMAIAICVFAAFGLPSSVAVADMMSACKTEISAKCAGVSKGRGRIAACLYAHGNQLSGGCKTEVDKVSNSSAAKRYVPAGILSLQGTEYEAGLRKACTADAKKLCPSVTIVNRVLVCLYSRVNKVSSGCKSEAKRVLDQL